jgi:SAM-dependent methyltransferase
VENGPASTAVENATLACRNEHRYRVRDGIPRFVDDIADSGQAQTAESFGYKWQQLWGHDGMTRAFYQDWFLRRFGFASLDDLGRMLSTRRYALDAGAGNAQSARWYTEFIRGHWVGVDISRSVDVARRHLAQSPCIDLVQADILALPFAPATFDLVISDGVLHHTPSTREALGRVAAVLQPGGEILFYVYRRKGAIREFSDDHVRDVVSGMAPERAWEVLKPITRLGESLAGMHATVRVPEDVPYLDMRAGEYDLQRFVYDHILKLFWNENFSFDENHHVNFDWFHPRYAHRQTDEQVEAWCGELGLRLVHWHVEVSGIAVRAVKE